MNTNISIPSDKFAAYAVSAFVLILLSGIANASGGPLQNPLIISNTSWSLSGNMQFTAYNVISGSSYNAVIGLNPPSNTGMSSANPYYTFTINPSSNKIITNIAINPKSNNSISFNFGNNANTLLVPGNIFGQWAIVLTITQVSNSSNTVSANANIGIMPPGTNLPTTFTMDYGGDQYNGTMVTNLSSVSKTFIVKESGSPLSVDNVLVQGGDDGIFVGNWNWAAPNSTNIKSTEVNYLPWVGCKTTTKNGSPSFMNLTITGATSNSLSFNVAAGQCTNSKPVSVSYTVNAIGSNTIYGTWNLKSNEYEDSRGLSVSYDGDYDKPFTGVYNSNYYTKAPLVNSTNTTLSLTILPQINPTMTGSANSVSTGSSITFTASTNGGESPYTYNFMVYNSSTNALVANMLFTDVASATNSFAYSPSSTGGYYANVIVTDSVPYSKNSNKVQFSVYSKLGFGTPNVAIPDSTLEIGQSETVTANVLGGKTPYTFAWTDNGNTIPGTTNTIAFTATANNLGINNLQAVVTDSNGQHSTGSGTVNVINSISFGTPQISIPNSVLYIGQSETVTANVLGGVLPYNSFAWTLNGNKLNFPSKSNSITFNANASDLGLDTLQVVVTDADGNTAAGTGTANVVNAPTITLTPSTSSVTSGESVTYTVTVNGGVGPFNVELYNITGSKQAGSNVIITSPGGSNTFTFKSGATGTFDYNAIATDTATNTLLNSTKATLTVNSAVCTSNCGGGGSGGGGGGGSGGNLVPTVKTSGNCTTISNFSQDNSERFTLNNQAFTVVENYINPNSAGVSVNGKAYLLDLNAPQNVLNTSGADYKITLKSISYLPIVDTITVELCYSSNQQQKQSSGAGSSMLVSLTTNKTISVQNGPVLLTGSITNGTTGPYKYDFIVTNSTGKIVFNKTDTNSKTSNSTVFTPLIPGIYTAAVKITTDGTTANSNKKDLTVSALQKTTTTIRPTTTATKVATAPPAAISNWIILLIIILIVIVLLAMYYYMNRRKNKSGKKQ